MTDTALEQSELEHLKQTATDAGISYSPNIGLDKLREKVREKLKPVAKPLCKKQQTANKVRKEALKLVRIRVSCINPNKSEFEGQFFASGNSVVPTQNIFVPFEIETHVPNIIYNVIKNSKSAYVKNEKDPAGKMVPVSKLRNEFQVELLPQLTKEELDNLAIEQSKRHKV